MGIDKVKKFFLGHAGWPLFVFFIIVLVLAFEGWDYLLGVGYTEELSRTIAFGRLIQIILLAVAMIGGFYGLVLNIRRLNIDERGLFNDRFGRGAELLSNSERHIRMASLRLFEKLHKDANETDQKDIRELILDFIHSRASQCHKESSEERIDIAKAIKVLGRLVPKGNRQELDLEGCHLKFLDLRGAKLQGAELQNADLGGTKLQDANLEGANLQDAYLEEGAKLQDVNLKEAKLQRAQLKGTELQGADMRAADLQNTELEGADLTEVDLKGVKNLTQGQLDLTIYEQGRPPKNLPEGPNLSESLALPKERAYTLEDYDADRSIRIFQAGAQVGDPVKKEDVWQGKRGKKRMEN